MAKFRNRQSPNIQDRRGMNDPTPRATQTSRQWNDGDGPTSDQRQTGQALGLSGQLADLQNEANKVQARKRTRVTMATRTEQLASMMGKR